MNDESFALLVAEALRSIFKGAILTETGVMWFPRAIEKFLLSHPAPPPAPGGIVLTEEPIPGPFAGAAGSNSPSPTATTWMARAEKAERERDEWRIRAEKAEHLADSAIAKCDLWEAKLGDANDAIRKLAAYAASKVRGPSRAAVEELLDAIEKQDRDTFRTCGPSIHLEKAMARVRDELRATAEAEKEKP